MKDSGWARAPVLFVCAVFGPFCANNELSWHSRSEDSMSAIEYGMVPYDMYVWYGMVPYLCTICTYVPTIAMALCV